ncbi:hypothetical protein ACIA8K_39085 [Catenuloplanes sp. NPDC051500]|uniref:hypothetical protein n=1 Tax=Catenuloplanes sp. NPDC051500 TaxID=3363959 RepID=UPI0037BCB3CB
MSDPLTLVPGNPAAPRPLHRGRVVAWSAAAGILLAVLWSFEFVDSVIGDNVANAVLQRDARNTAIAGTTAGLIFAFVSGLAGTFTACNIAMAAAVGPMSQAGAGNSRRDGIVMMLRPAAWLTAGMVVVSSIYGFVGVLLGPHLPQLSTDTVGDVPVRLVQSAVVFGIIGLALIYLGLAALGVLPDVFGDHPIGRVVTLGALIGGFLIGRPYPMFNKLFHWAVDTHNPVYGAAAFVLQSLGNITLVTGLFVLLVIGTRGRFVSWLADNPRRTTLLTAALLIGLGVFTVVYWDIRLPARFGIGWFPTMPYNH